MIVEEFERGIDMAKATLAIDRGLVKAGERVCVAISGGADSTALLLGLWEANQPGASNKEPLGIVLSAVHVHHGLRATEADADETFVRNLCERLGLPLQVFHVDTPARQAAEREGLEEAARGLRYDAFRAWMAEGSADTIATAHTLDDQAETVVMKMLRGAWTEGLGGISPVVENSGANPHSAGRIIRPLLGARRAQVEAYLRDRQQSWRDDTSNRDLGLTRNRVRHELMPGLRSFNPSLDECLARMAGIARDEEAFWAGEVSRVLSQVLLPGKPVRGGGRAVSTTVGEASCAIEIERLKAMPAALRRRIVRAAARSLGDGPGCSLGAEDTAKVLALAGFGGREGVLGRIGSRLELRGGLRVERSARELRFWRQV
jgi:tRNA(Ile)-lysidine synthase